LDRGSIPLSSTKVLKIQSLFSFIPISAAFITRQYPYQYRAIPFLRLAFAGDVLYFGNEGKTKDERKKQSLSILKPYFMARTTKNIILHQLRGQIGKQLVVKQYGNKTVVTRYPDMSQVKPSPLQTKRRKVFAKAVAYARGINNDPQQKIRYAKKAKRGQSVYHYALKEYLQQAGQWEGGHSV